MVNSDPKVHIVYETLIKSAIMFIVMNLIILAVLLLYSLT